MDKFNKDKLAIVLGGTEDHILLIEKLQRMQYFVILIDYNDNPPARESADQFIQKSILDKEAVLEIAKAVGARLVVAACIDQALPSMAYVSEELGLPCHLSYSKALEVTNKAYMKKRFSRLNILTAKYRIVKKDEVITDLKLNLPFVVKPLDSNGSKGVTKVDNYNKVRQAIENAMIVSRSNQFIIEEYIDGKELSADVLIRNKEAKVLMVTENVKSKINIDSFTIVQSFFDIDIHLKYENIIRIAAEQIVDAFDLDNTTLLIQLKVKDDLPWIIEFSPRIGGGSKHHFIKETTGVDILDLYLSFILKNDLWFVEGSHLYRYGAVNYLYAKNGTFLELTNAARLKKSKVISDFFYYKTPGMLINNHLTSVDRPAGYLVVDNDYKLFTEKIETAKANIHIFNDKNVDLKLELNEI